MCVYIYIPCQIYVIIYDLTSGAIHNGCRGHENWVGIPGIITLKYNASTANSG